MANYLIHHGIQGMHWGERNGPPYPLDSSQKTSEEKRAGSSKSSNLNKDIADKILKRHGDDRTGMIAEIAFAASPIVISALTLAGTSISEKHDRVKKTNEQLDELNLRKKYNNLSDIPKSKSTNVKDYIKEINPKFNDKKDAGSKMNCILCTTALAMREKGYKANAQSSILGFYPKEYFNRTFKGAEYGKIKANTATQYLKSLAKLGDGAYGHLSVQWRYGGKHSLFFKNEKGTTRIYDGQSGKEIEYRKNDNNFFQAIKIDQSHYIRLDKAEPTEKVLGAIK